MANIKGIIILIIILSMAGVSVVIYQKKGEPEKPQMMLEEDGYNKDFFKDASKRTKVKPKSLKELGFKRYGE